MNTISIPAGRTNQAARVSRGMNPAIALCPRERNTPSWLPAPAPSRPHLQRRPSTGAAGHGLHREWISASREGAGERYLMTVLAAVALLGIGYGFSCLIDLVQNWAWFNLGIQRLVQ